MTMHDADAPLIDGYHSLVRIGRGGLGDVYRATQASTGATVAIKVERVLKEETARVGESYSLRFKVTDSSSNQPKPNLEDLGVLVFLAPGIWQHREPAKHVGNGVYEMNFVPPQAGVYYVYFQCPSLGVQFNQITALILRAMKTQ